MSSLSAQHGTGVRKDDECEYMGRVLNSYHKSKKVLEKAFNPFSDTFPFLLYRKVRPMEQVPHE